MKFLGNNKQLDDSREAFCKAIINSGVGVVQAYKNYIDPSANDRQALTMGVQLCEDEAVKDRLLFLKESRSIVNSIDKNSVLAEVARMGSVSPIDYYDDEFNIKSPSTWTENMKTACKSIKPTKAGIEIQTVSKEWCIDTINKMKGYIKEEPSFIHIGSKFDNMSEKELAEYAEFTEVDDE